MAVKFFQISHQALNLHNFCLFPRNVSLVSFRTLNWLLIVIVINVVIGGFSGENLKWLTHETVWLQVSDYTVQLQLCRLISAKYSNLCNNHIWQNCNCYDLCVNECILWLFFHHFLFLPLFLSSPLKAKLVLAFIQFPLDFRLPWWLGGVILLRLLCGLVRCSVGNKTNWTSLQKLLWVLNFIRQLQKRPRTKIGVISCALFIFLSQCPFPPKGVNGYQSILSPRGEPKKILGSGRGRGGTSEIGLDWKTICI